MSVKIIETETQDGHNGQQLEHNQAQGEMI